MACLLQNSNIYSFILKSSWTEEYNKAVSYFHAKIFHVTMTWRVAQVAEERGFYWYSGFDIPHWLDLRVCSWKNSTKFWTVNTQSLCSVDSFNSGGIELTKFNLEFKSGIFMAEEASKKKNSFYKQIGYNLRNKPAKCYIWSIDLWLLE